MRKLSQRSFAAFMLAVSMPAFAQTAPVEDDGANPAFASAAPAPASPHMDAWNRADHPSVHYADEYRTCLMATARRMASATREPADVVVRAAGSRCQRRADGSDLLFLLRTASMTEAYELETAYIRDGGRPRGTAIVRIEAEQAFDSLLQSFNDQALAAVVDARSN